MKQWMRRFFAVLMMLCLLAGCTAWAEKALDGKRCRSRDEGD